MVSKIFHHPIIVSENDIDELNHVNNTVYLKYVQDAASAHWYSLASPEISSQLYWIVRRHEIDYLKPAFLNDELIAKTWVEIFSGVTSKRHCEIYRGTELLTRSCTTWVSVDCQTLKPKRIDENITEIFYEL